MTRMFERLDFTGSVVQNVGEGGRELVPRRDLKPIKAERASRRSRKSVAVGPYAPQLIRLVRRRFRLEKVRGARRRYRGEEIGVSGGAELRARVDWQAELRASLAEWSPVRTGSPVRERIRHFVIRPSRWALSPGLAPGVKRAKKVGGRE